MKNISMYFHAGSANHGCEAIVRSTCKICSQFEYKIKLFSSVPQEDNMYKLNNIIFDISAVGFKRYSWMHIIAAFKYKILRNKSAYDELFYNKIWKCNNDGIAMSIGGDNYCYGMYPITLANINKKLNSVGVKTVLWGCSVEPDLLKNIEVVEDMKRYSLITARESITYNALIKAGITQNTKLYPDPAFYLDTVRLHLTSNFIENKTIGINVSPLIQQLEQDNSITYRNYHQLIKFIIDETDNNVALIPHVIKKTDNDLEPLKQLYSEFKDTGRIILIEDHNCMELKGFISRCRMFIGARTHATIAAYSTCVPTLVVGYSVKAKGIAKDIFGTYENYVLPVQSLQNDFDLTNAFKWLCDNENDIRTHLQNFMPSYIEKAWQAGYEIRKLMEE